MKFLRFLMLFSLILNIFFLNSCGTPTSSFTVEKKAMPTDFGVDENCILICILQGRESRDYYMRKQITNEYLGKYIFITMAELESSSYADKNIYRYLLDYNHSTVSQTTYNTQTQRTSTMTAGSSNYYILDRKENKEYNNKRSGSAFSKIIRAYAINLELVRLKNKKTA